CGETPEKTVKTPTTPGEPEFDEEDYLTESGELETDAVDDKADTAEIGADDMEFAETLDASDDGEADAAADGAADAETDVTKENPEEE
ncbi:MAG: hypothetical protein LUE92_07545, partial [Clostridiales bacterium]|nr:hypothetical protein [Clostridiales bacterium]